MSAIKRLLTRWGYARLDEFGLLLTPDGRILATRPGVLDDGLGGCVVGWRNGDLAALELAPWTPPASEKTPRPPVTAKQRPASIASKVREPPAPVQRAIPEPVAPVQRTIPGPVAPVPAAMADPVAPVQPTMPEPVPATIPPPVAAQAPSTIPAHVTAPASPAIPDHAVVAPTIEAEPAAEQPPDEDEWEWEIVMARARVAAEPIEEPAAPPTVAAGSSRWLARTALTELDDDTAVTPAAKLSPRSEPGLAPAALRPSQLGNPKTVIPVPRLPAAADPAAMMRSMTPVRTQRSAGQGVPVARSFRRIATRR
jgi:hypothetical protein